MAKFLATILTFFLITGSHANGSGEASTPTFTVDELVNAAADVVLSLPFIVAWSSPRIFDTNTSRALNEIFGSIPYRLNHIDKEISPELVETFEMVTSVLKGVGMKTFNAVSELKPKEAITGILISVLSPYFDPVLERTIPQLHPFKDTFQGWMRELGRIYPKSLTEQIQDLEAEFAFYLKELEDAKVTLQSIVDQEMTRLRQGLEALLKNLKPHLKRFMEENPGFKEEFKQWVTAPFIPPEP